MRPVNRYTFATVRKTIVLLLAVAVLAAILPAGAPLALVIIVPIASIELVADESFGRAVRLPFVPPAALIAITSQRNLARASLQASVS